MRKKETRIIEDVDDAPSSAPPPNATPPPDMRRDTFMGFMSRFGKEKMAQCRIKIETPNGLEYVTLKPIAEVKNEETIAQLHRESKYADQTGVYHLEVEINGECFPMDPIRIAPQKRSLPLPDNSAPWGGVASYNPVADLLREMREESRQAREQTNQILLAIINRPQSSMAEMLQGMASLDQMRTANSFANPDTLLKYLELGRTLANGNSEGWDGLLRDVVRDVAPAIVPALPTILKGFSKAPTAPGPVPTVRPETEPVKEPEVLPEGQPMPEQPKPKQEPDDRELLANVRGAIQFLKTRCLKQTPPELYVANALDWSEDPIYARIISTITDPDPDAFEKFVSAFDPEIGREPYRGWFLYLFNGIRSELEQANQMVHDSGRNSRDPGDGRHNGTSGPKRGK